MPLDLFQKRVAKIISVNRTENSPFAGGSMIQKDGFRLSNDSDIFARDEDVAELYEADRRLLEADGFFVELSRNYPGFIEAIVSSQDEELAGTTRLQWVLEGLNGFFTPVPDADLGFRLHFLDLSVNKLLACAGRKEARDFVDLWMIDQYSMPLWRLALAAPGKDIKWSPQSLIEKVAANMVFSRSDFEDDLVTMVDLDPSQVMRDLMASVELARNILPDHNVFTYGQVAVHGGRILDDPEPVVGCKWIAPRPGGGNEWSAYPDDHLVERIVAKFGPEGSLITDSLTFP